MPSLTEQLTKKGLAKPNPSGIEQGVQFEVVMGSVAYACNQDNSDFDVYGFACPEKDYIFPHLRGEIEGFGPKGQRFEVWQQHHMYDASAQGGAGRNYDMSIYSIVKYFDLVMNNNPNMLDSLFVPTRCILYTTPIGEMVRENRHLFVCKKAWHSFKGYAFQQLHKMKNKNPPDGKRKLLVDKFGYDVKFGYHVVRLMLEVEMILSEHTLDLERHRETFKSIRRGDWKLSDIESFFQEKEASLEKLYHSSTLPYKPREAEIKQLLLNCLEQHFGTLENCIQVLAPGEKLARGIEELLQKYRQETPCQIPTKTSSGFSLASLKKLFLPVS